MTKAITKAFTILLLFVGFAFTAFYYSVAQPSDNFVFAGWESEPFYYKGPRGVQGAIFDIINEICQLQKMHCTFQVLEFRDSIEKLKKGETQGGGPYAFTFPRATLLSFSPQIFSSTYGFYTLPKIAAKISSYDDLQGASIGVLGLSASRVSLEAVNEFVDGKLIIFEEKNISSILHKVEEKKYMLGYTNRDAAQSWITKNHSKLVEVPNISEKLDYRFALSKKGLSEEKINAILNTVPKLRQSGFLKKIATKYKLNLSDVEKSQ